MAKYPLTNGNYAEAVIQVGVDGSPASAGAVTIDTGALATSAKQTTLETNLFGKAGHRVVSNTTAGTGTFIGFIVLSPTAVFTSLTATGGEGSIAGITFNQGFSFPAAITGYQLTSGTVAFIKG